MAVDCCGDLYTPVMIQVEDRLGCTAEQNQVWKMKYSDLLQPTYLPTRATFKTFIKQEAYQRQKQRSLILTYDFWLVNWRHLVLKSSQESKNAVSTIIFLISTANILSITLSQGNCIRRVCRMLSPSLQFRDHLCYFEHTGKFYKSLNFSLI